MTDEKDVGSNGSEEFDFTGANEAGKKEEEPTEENGLVKPTEKELEKKITEHEEMVANLRALAAEPKKPLTKKRINQLRKKGQETPEIIAEARELAGSKVGLDIDKFFKKHGLVNVNLDKMLHHPLNEETGYYA